MRKRHEEREKCLFLSELTLPKNPALPARASEPLMPSVFQFEQDICSVPPFAAGQPASQCKAQPMPPPKNGYVPPNTIVNPHPGLQSRFVISVKAENDCVCFKLCSLQAEVNCMKDSLSSTTPWKYYINLASQVFPLKTNEEIVQILKIYNGSNIIQSYYGKHIQPKRFLYGIDYTVPKYSWEKPKIRSNRSSRNPPPPHNITILKGSAYGVFRCLFFSCKK